MNRIIITLAAAMTLVSGQASAQSGFVGTNFRGHDNADAAVTRQNSETSVGAKRTGADHLVGTAFIGQENADQGLAEVRRQTGFPSINTFGAPSPRTGVYLGTAGRYQNNADGNGR